ncbi:MAG: WYL domain-containing protein, partial [Proteobacteria bacterium]
IGAVKWKNGEIVGTFETLLKPTTPMGAEVIGIHGITNEMVESAPSISEKIAEFYEFIKDAVVVAHHAPFDLGFVAHEFEKAGLPLPTVPALCTSLLSRNLFLESENHRLQTLIKFFNLPQGTAHRALDDTKACLEVGLRCLEKTGTDADLKEAFAAQGGLISWQRFSMKALDEKPAMKTMKQAIAEQKIVEMNYGSTLASATKRKIHPHGLVRSLDGDFVMAYDEKEQRSKRYYVEKIQGAEIV